MPVGIISNISLALLIITIIFLSLYMVLQGNRQDKPRLRNAGLAVFIVMNVVVIFVAQGVLISEEREPIYNLDYIRAEMEEENPESYDTARIAFLDLVNSPIPEYLKGLKAQVQGVDPYNFGIFNYQCPHQIFYDFRQGLSGDLLPSSTLPGEEGLWNSINKDSFDFQLTRFCDSLGTQAFSISESLYFGSTQNQGFLHFFAIDSVKEKVIQIAIRK